LEVLLKLNRPDFIKLVTALKGGSLKGVGFKPVKPGVQDQKWKTTFMLPKLGNIRSWNLLSPIEKAMFQHGGGK
jgi:hypothetical protein